jgi:hypothetical protein
MTGASRFCARDLAGNIARFSYARCPLVSRLSLALSALALYTRRRECMPARARALLRKFVFPGKAMVRDRFLSER